MKLKGHVLEQPIQQHYVADLSLALINKTGAYHICRDLIEQLPQHFAGLRYWRLYRTHEPTGLMRCILGKAMLLELSNPSLAEHLPRWNGSHGPDRPTLYLDPLYVLHSRLDSRDIVLCHDVGPVSMPDLFDPSVTKLYARAYRRIADAGPGMVFVSAASRLEFQRIFGVNFRFMKIIPLYVRQGSRTGREIAPKNVIKPFLLTVAALEARKNYLRSIDAFDRSGLRDRGFSYVFCGPRANQSEAIEELAQRTPAVRALGYLSDAELRWLYQNAEGFVLPSLLEGFGMPALEAAQHGLLSVVSHMGALPEVVGEGAILVDPLDSETIAEGMRRLVDMPPAERSYRIGVAREHAASHSIERYVSRWSDLLANA